MSTNLDSVFRFCRIASEIMATLLDAQTVVVGMQPSVAITLVELGLSMKGIRTALDVEKGMVALQAAVSELDGDGDEDPFF